MKNIVFATSHLKVSYDGWNLTAKVKGVKNTTLDHPAVREWLLGKKASLLFKRACAARGWNNPLIEYRKRVEEQILEKEVQGTNSLPYFDMVMKLISIAKRNKQKAIGNSRLSLTLDYGTVKIAGSHYLHQPRVIAAKYMTKGKDHLFLVKGKEVDGVYGKNFPTYASISVYEDACFISLHFEKLCQNLDELKEFCSEIESEIEFMKNLYNQALEKVSEQLIY